MRLRVLLAPCLLGATSVAFAQTNTNSSIAATASIYFPSSTEIKDLIGAQQYSFGLTPWGGNSAKNGLIPNLSFMTGSGHGNKYLLIPFTYNYEKDFSPVTLSGGTSRMNGTSFAPYVSVGAGINYFDYSITRASGDHFGVKRFGSTANAEVGLKISNSAKLFAKYDIFSAEQHFSFNGLQLGVVLSAFKL